MRALYTAASGLTAQQTRLDVISHNMANLNTVGFKEKQSQFAEMLRSEFTQPDEFQLQGRASAAGLRIGNGSYAAHLGQIFSQGSIQTTGNNTDLAVQGEGFFTIGIPSNGSGSPYQTAFTRSGNFHVDGNGMLVTDEGYPLLNQSGQPIRLPAGVDGQSMSVKTDGQILADSGNGPAYVDTVNLVLVRNPEENLQEVGDNLYRIAPGTNYNPLNDSLGKLTQKSDLDRIGTIRQGALEMANVDLAKEMADLMEVQRAYQINARSVATIDTMMGLANNLRS
ncbi:flagellar hook-basal body protein [Effusibacillus dendaii]|uniref:Flagellar basal body rod protein FlgG n=1 Tax=Effusibacillus dendaii TaxID=2743772 RepID=A0A7I8DFV5_9BACL|nr:flagellar hook-basal body protein [Effusibacillus dendaii]BCJ87746.1 flagellar basal body rod protein FlgG [Effusibacillus dendaii]